MIGDVHDFAQFRDRVEQDSLDTLLERDLGKPTALTSAKQTEICNRPVNGHEFGATAMIGYRRVDLLGQHLLYPVDQRTTQITRRSRDGRGAGELGLFIAKP